MIQSLLSGVGIRSCKWFAWTVLLGMLASGCSMHLRSEPSAAATDIAGRWRLPAPQHDALVARLRTIMGQVRDKQDQRDRRDAQHRPPPEIDLSPPDAGSDASVAAQPGRGHKRIPWELREQIEQQEALLNSAVPNADLQIIQGADRIEFILPAGGHRRFDRGVSSTLVTNYGTFRIESGWQANVYVVHSHDSERNIDIVERYQRVGDHLRVRIQLHIPDAKEQLLTAEYSLVSP